MDNETWHPISSPYSHYEVSTHGNVRNAVKGRTLSQTTNNLGYRKVTLAALDWSERSHASVHRLVAMAFIPGDHALDVNHKDMNKANNHWLNLEWCTHAENIRHGLKTHPTWAKALAAHAKRKGVAVVSVDTDGTEVRYASIADAARALGNVNKGPNIHAAISQGSVSYGKQWRYA